MNYYAGLDLPMETTQFCIVDENSRKKAFIEGIMQAERWLHS